MAERKRNRRNLAGIVLTASALALSSSGCKVTDWMIRRSREVNNQTSSDYDQERIRRNQEMTNYQFHTGDYGATQVDSSRYDH